MSKSATNMPSGGQLYLRLLKYARFYWVALVIGIVGNALYSGVDASLTYFLKPVLDKGFIGKDIHFLKVLPLIVLGIFLLRGIANFLGSYFMSYVARSIVMRFRQDIFAHLLKSPATFYDKSSSGNILSVIIYNVEQVAKVSATALTNLFQSGFLVIGLLVVMFHISWRLSLIYFAAVPVIAIFVKLSSRHLRKIGHGIQQGMGEITSIAEESIISYKVVRTFGGEAYESNKFNKATKDNRRRELKNVVLKVVSTSVVQIIAAIALATILYLATSHGRTALSAGSFVALVASMLAILKPLKTLTSINATIQKGLAGAQSIFSLLDSETEKDTGKKVIERVKGDIEFSDVNFAYNDEDGSVLKNINFTAKAGQTIALVGRSGSGKSTLARLLPRFYEADSGSVNIDGWHVGELTLASLRQQIALVSQQVTMFNDTIANNIAYGAQSGASDEKIIEALQAAYAWEFVSKLPEGIHTIVGENGVLLSGGQRQRLAIARAILKNAPILILDEATSALDTESERFIQAALENLIHDRTTIVIAHRLSTIENADKILVMDQGEILESGTHKELLALQGHYASLHALQFSAEE
jgi:subfamily B ATP-binding cassette protein MsbA